MMKKLSKFRASSVGYFIFLTTILSLFFLLGVNTASAANGTTNIPALDWLISNFVLLFILIIIISLLIVIFLIYRRHKKFGLGPRIVSIFYIDGFNLKSIGNILCIVGIIIVIISLFYPWYVVSYDAQSDLNLEAVFEAPLKGDIIYLDGINGIKVTIPGLTEPLPISSMPIPFSLVIGISILFLILATVGIPLSKKLGWKYLWYGIKLLIPVILILIGVVALGMISSSFFGGVSDYFDVKAVINSVSSSPFGGNTAVPVSISGVSGTINLQWGLGLGAWLLLIAAIIMLVAGILEIISKTQFFATKIPLPGQAPPIMPVRQTPIPSQQPPIMQQPPPPSSQPPAPQKQAPSKVKPRVMFCPECGSKLADNATFCANCGKKLGK